MKQEEPQIHGKYWRHETGGRYKQEKTEYRACRGDSWDREKAGRSRKSPAAKKAEETLNEKKSRGRRKLRLEKAPRKEQEAEAAPARRRSWWRKVVQGHLWERKWRLLYHLQYRYFCF